MAATAHMHGDFTGLAETYSAFRSGYAPSVRAALLGLLGRPPTQLDAVDVAAGTGIWSRMVADAGFRHVTAIEPNGDMRRTGVRDSAEYSIKWSQGTAEATGLPDDAVDLVTIASALHWVSFDEAMVEFQRILRSGGWFAALWNTRQLESNPLLEEIEGELTRLKPDLERVSSGRGGITLELTERLATNGGFCDVVFVEGRHVEIQTPAKYLGAWASVNDVRVQLGEADFNRFLKYADRRLRGFEQIEVTYLTRAWMAQVA